MITLKKIVRNWLLPALLLPALLTACTDDTFTDNRTRVEEGLPAQITLGFQARKSQIETRAAQGEVYENQVNNLYVFIFDKAGEIHYRKFFDTGDIDYQDGDNLLHSGSIDIETKSLNDARIVCIANLSNDNVHTSYEVTQADMDAVQSLDKLNEFIMKMSQPGRYLHQHPRQRAGNSDPDMQAGARTHGCQSKVCSQDGDTRRQGRQMVGNGFPPARLESGERARTVDAASQRDGRCRRRRLHVF